MNILEDIALRAKERVAARKRQMPLAEMITEARWATMFARRDFPFEKALRNDAMAFICEVKKASPSKGIIAEGFPYLRIAQDYQKAGAHAISVLTEPDFFLGDNRHLSEIAQHVGVPLLRKDFIVDAYMVYEARMLGASAVLLICALMKDEAQLAEYIRIAEGISLSAVVETHTEAEVEMALKAGARIIGVNNRDLATFKVDLATSERLGRLIPKDRLFIAESGIRTPDDIARLRAAGANAVLVGETLMRSHDRKAALQRLHGHDTH
ncbi:MAG: indole-3-glycerol phosphate synthase TrpC [Kiritimatiellaeota bacterium]|nr:indole-3-glycerol phosphate synthase TrpC [Kiritimatiellota bacterium]